MTYPRPTVMPMGIVVISCVRLSIQLSVGLGFGVADKLLVRTSTFWHADVSRWVILRLLTLMDITVRLSIAPAIWVWVCWVWVWLGQGCHTSPGDGCCHHWGIPGISVAFTGSIFKFYTSFSTEGLVLNWCHCEYSGSVDICLSRTYIISKLNIESVQCGI